MFKNRALYVEMVKKNPTTPDSMQTVDAPDFDPEMINTMLKDQVNNITSSVIIVMAVGTVLTTISQIVIRKATK